MLLSLYNTKLIKGDDIVANICSFSMFVRGEAEDIKCFYNAMCQNGNIYMGRGADAEINLDEEDGSAHIDGWCKWSVQSALVDNATDMRNNPGKWYWGENVDPSKLEFITLWEACREWNIDMEVYSEEGGCCFQEHYVCIKGDVICDECVEWYEYFIDDYNSKKDAEEELGIKITDDEWACRDTITRGGFESWDFEI